MGGLERTLAVERWVGGAVGGAWREGGGVGLQLLLFGGGGGCWRALREEEPMSVVEKAQHTDVHMNTHPHLDTHRFGCHCADTSAPCTLETMQSGAADVTQLPPSLSSFFFLLFSHLPVLLFPFSNSLQFVSLFSSSSSSHLCSPSHLLQNPQRTHPVAE